MPDYDDPTVQAHWEAERRSEVSKYLAQEGVAHGHVGRKPAWSVPPYVGLWSVEGRASDSPGWWVICGDLPSDYVSSTSAQSAREAVAAIASLWAEAAAYMERGEKHPTFVIGTGELGEELAPLLASRSALLLEWVEDPEAWEE